MSKVDLTGFASDLATVTKAQIEDRIRAALAPLEDRIDALERRVRDEDETPQPAPRSAQGDDVC